MVGDAENARARIYDVKGNNSPVLTLEDQINDRLNAVREQTTQMEHEVSVKQNTSAFIADEDYLLVASHLDQTLCEKISAGQYVDFSKLIKKDRQDEDSQK